MWQKKIALAFVVLSGLGSRPVYAGSISIIPRPDASYLAITNLIEISAPDFASVASITDGSQVITFSTPMEVRTVPTSWSTWGFPPNTESATPRVLWTEGIEAMTLTLALPSEIVGFEAEPDFLGVRKFSVSFFEGTSLAATITTDVDGFAGAMLFAVEDGSASLTSVTISSDADFAIAAVRYSLVVPEPDTLFLVAAALVAVGWLRVLALCRRGRDARTGRGSGNRARGSSGTACARAAAPARH